MDDHVVSVVVRVTCLVSFVAAVYLCVIVGFGRLVESRGPHLGLSLLATAMVGAGYPLVHAAATRLTALLVHRGRQAPSDVVESFARRISAVADETSLVEIARFLREATRAARAEVWIRVGDSLQRASVWPGGPAFAPVRLEGDVGDVVLPNVDCAVASVYGGEVVGALGIAKRDGDGVDALDEVVLTDIASQVGVLLRNVRLTAELQQRVDEVTAQASEIRDSRQRIVEAQDAERKALERNIHDGAQQHLVALAVRLGLAQSLIERDRSRAIATLEDTERMIDDALSVLRDFARGLTAPELAELGLEAALREQSARLPVRVHFDATAAARYPADVEAAVYFSCLEALQNVAKHAMATDVRVELTDDGHMLSFAVTDDGRGFDRDLHVEGVGLRNMRERLHTAGGDLRIESAPGRGTRVAGQVPTGGRPA